MKKLPSPLVGMLLVGMLSGAAMPAMAADPAPAATSAPPAELMPIYELPLRYYLGAGLTVVLLPVVLWWVSNT